jgi:hypothetical protein
VKINSPFFLVNTKTVCTFDSSNNKNTMKLFKLTSPLYPIWKNGSSTGEYQKIDSFINPAFIVSITKYKGSCLHEGWLCSKVVVNEGNSSASYYDERMPNDLSEAIEKFN